MKELAEIVGMTAVIWLPCAICLAVGLVAGYCWGKAGKKS